MLMSGIVKEEIKVSAYTLLPYNALNTLVNKAIGRVFYLRKILGDRSWIDRIKEDNKIYVDKRDGKYMGYYYTKRGEDYTRYVVFTDDYDRAILECFLHIKSKIF